MNKKAVIISLGLMWAIATGNLINSYELINSSAASAFSFIILFYLMPVLIIVKVDELQS